MKVSQKKYNLAVITVLGKEADAVVAEDSKTAKECVQYLKEQRVALMTFIPLREIKVHEPEESLRRHRRHRQAVPRRGQLRLVDASRDDLRHG